MAKTNREQQHQCFQLKFWDRPCVLFICTAVLSATCAFSCIPIVGHAATHATDSGEHVESTSSSYRIQVLDENQHPISGSQTLRLKEADIPYMYTLKAEGTAETGYGILTFTHTDGSSTIKYLSPIAPEEEVHVILYAAAGTKMEFDFAPGTPDADEEDIVDPLSFIDNSASEEQDDAAVSSVYLQISETPYISYSVPDRATIEQIAGHYRTSPETIRVFNGMEPDEQVCAGQELLIPNPATTTPYTPAQQYIVAKGDTLGKLAQKFGVTIDGLRAWNGIGENGDIYPGLVLDIPIVYEDTVEQASTAEETLPKEEPEDATAADSAKPAPTEATEGKEKNQEDYVTNVPLYFQNDYENCLYGNGTVATSGCSVTSLTMVANAITGYDYTVDELADYFGGQAESNIERLEKGSEALGLSFYKSENWDKTWAALQDGKLAIVLMEDYSLFTNTQHFIVLTGLSEDGKRIFVNDPNEDNYSYWETKQGLENGFTPNQMLRGYGGSWIYEPELEELPKRYSEDRIDKQRVRDYFSGEKNDDGTDWKVVSPNYPEIRLNWEDRELLAKLIWAEARGESLAGQQAVAEVVFNRMVTEQFGDTIRDVIYSKGQFRSTSQLKEAETWQAQYQAIERALFGTPVLNRNVLYFATYLSNSNTYMLIGNHIFCYDMPGETS